MLQKHVNFFYFEFHQYPVGIFVGKTETENTHGGIGVFSHPSSYPFETRINIRWLAVQQPSLMYMRYPCVISNFQGHSIQAHIIRYLVCALYALELIIKVVQIVFSVQYNAAGMQNV